MSVKYSGKLCDISLRIAGRTMKNIYAIDIVDRLVRAKPFWFNGNPTIKLTGLPGTFGSLLFDFGDDIISYKIRIKDCKHILYIAKMDHWIRLCDCFSKI